MRFKTHGIISAMVTPFTKNGVHVDLDKLAPLTRHLIDKGVAGLFVCGTTGEGMLLTPEERRAVLEKVIEAAGKKVQVIAHTGALDTATTVALSEHAREAGATAISVVAPGYYGYDDRALERFFKTVAKAVSGFPVMLYNIPGCAKNYIEPELQLKLAEIDNIVGVKDSTGDMGTLTWLLGNAPKDFNIINGVDHYGYQAFLAGAPAAVSGTSNVVGEIYNDLYQHVQKGNLKKAWALQVTLAEACRSFAYGRMSATIKEGMRLRGFDAGDVRAPQRELTAGEKKTLAGKMEALGLI